MSISNTRVPSDHQSTALPWPTPCKISGAMYSGVPQKVCAALGVLIISFDRPKSVRHTWPTSSRRIFSGLRSR